MGDKMRQELLMLQENNQKDSLLTNDSLATSLCNYFDEHGTANERMLAHYLLARTYADMKQSPRALDEFHHAAELADTTNTDCDYKTLARIFGQMGDLLYAHQLPRNALNAYQTAYHYSLKAGETNVAPYFYAQQNNCYYDLSMRDSSEYIMRNAIRMLNACGDTLAANSYKGPLSYILVQKKDYDNAKEYLNDYEYHSFINEGTIQQSDNWKLLYIYKAYYFQHTHQCDSALYYYYKTIHTSQSPNNITLGLLGIYQTYNMLQQHDSVSKYAVLYAQKNDETFRKSNAATLMSMHHLYNYHRFETLAEQKTREAYQAIQKNRLLLLCLIILIITAILTLIIFHNYQKLKQQKLYAQYSSAIHNYISTKRELEHLQKQNIINEHLVKQTKEDLKYFQKTIAETRQRFTDIDKWGLEDMLAKTDIIELLKKKGIKGLPATEKELHEMRRIFHLCLPGFKEALSEQYHELTIKELNICMLIKLHFAPSQISSLTHMSSSAISNLRKRLLKKMFNIEGGAGVFDEKIRQISCQTGL